MWYPAESVLRVSFSRPIPDGTYSSSSWQQRIGGITSDAAYVTAVDGLIEVIPGITGVLYDGNWVEYDGLDPSLLDVDSVPLLAFRFEW